MTSFSTIVVERLGPVGRLTLNRPAVHNALNVQAVSEMASACNELDQDEAIRVIVVSGAGKSFCAGLDTKEARDTNLDHLFVWDGGDREALGRCRKPTIASVQGAAMGAGCELALMCDIILASEDARFSQPEIRRNSMPGVGGTQRLTRLIGRSRAMELCLTGRTFDASEAFRLGLVNEVMSVSMLAQRTSELATEIAAKRLLPILAIKESIRAADELSLSAGLLIERRLSLMAIATREAT